MRFKYIFIVFLILLSESAFSQRITSNVDSTHIYTNIETYSQKSKFTRFIYSLIFKPNIVNPKKLKAYKKQIRKPYSSFEGKTIRNINIETLDPFGLSIADTINTNPSFLSKTGNKLHYKTRVITIRNLLLIHQNQKFDSLRLKESERLVRSRGYIRDVSFLVKSVSENSVSKKSLSRESDSVDVFIRVLDKWSLIPEVASSTSDNSVILTDRNFLGTGHEFKNQFTRNISNGENSYSTNYYIPNIWNTYITTSLHYELDGYKNFNKSLIIDRPFYSPFAKWAAGVSFESQYSINKPVDHSIYVPFTLKFNTQDYWAGYAMPVSNGKSVDERSTRLILAGRYLHVRYFEKPLVLLDPIQNYANENFYLSSIGLSTRKYIQDKYIFNYGVIEDVPVGRVFELTGGYQWKDHNERFYLGMRYSFGDYHAWGYLSSNFEYGTFFNKSIAEQGVFSLRINYFTELFEIGKWKFRQFVKPQATFGLNRFSYDSLTLNKDFGLEGFSSSKLSGTSRLLLTIQTQSYAPWSLLGFRFGPFLTYSLGVLGNEKTGFKNNKVYSQLGIGVLIKNDNLIFNTFQISLSFYPLIPGNGYNVFKTNSYQTEDFGFSSFETGKPATTAFQ